MAAVPAARVRSKLNWQSIKLSAADLLEIGGCFFVSGRAQASAFSFSVTLRFPIATKLWFSSWVLLSLAEIDGVGCDHGDYFCCTHNTGCCRLNGLPGSYPMPGSNPSKASRSTSLAVNVRRPAIQFYWYDRR